MGRRSSDQIVRIRKLTALATDVISLELEAATDSPLAPFEAGAHIDVYVKPDLIRQYSLCNDPAERHRYRLGILREANSRGGSTRIHDTFREGQEITVGLPRSQFRLISGARRSVLVAGGIGITPLLAMAYQLDRTSAHFELHYCARSIDRVAFLDELVQCRFGDKVRIHLDDGPSSQRFSLEESLSLDAAGTHVYVCGPTGFIEYVKRRAVECGLESDQIHFEHFTAQASADATSFSVHAALSNVSVTVERDKTIAQALFEAGVQIPLSCEQGVCGTCLTRVLQGTPDHRDQYQTDDEKAANTHMTPCCSRALSDSLVLEI